MAYELILAGGPDSNKLQLQNEDVDEVFDKNDAKDS